MKNKIKIEGTKKFIVYFYNGKNVRSKHTAMPEHFVYKQWGRVFQVDEAGNTVGQGKAFTNYGDMLKFINDILSNSVRNNLKNIKTWRSNIK